MGILSRLKPDPTCSHGVPLQSTCHHCTPRQRRTAEAERRQPAKKPADPKKATTGTYRTGPLGGTRKTNRHAK